MKAAVEGLERYVWECFWLGIDGGAEWRGEERDGGRGEAGVGMRGGRMGETGRVRRRWLGLRFIGWRTLDGGSAGEGGWGMREGKCRREAGGCGMEGRARTIASTGEAALVRFTITAEDTGLDQKRART